MIQSAAVCATLVPMLLVAYAFLGSVLTPRWSRILLGVQALLVILMILLPGPAHTCVISIFASVVLPVAFYADDLRARLLAAALLLVSVRTAEMVGSSVWMLATGGASAQSIASSWANYPAHAASALFAALVMGLLLWVFARQFALVRAALHGHVMTLVAFLVVQSAALLVLGNAILRDAPDNAGLICSAAFVCLLCVIVDAGMLRVAGRLRVRDEELRRARELGHEIEELARRAQREMDAMSQTAMLRHDVRNHLQVLRSLLEEDDAEATEYVRSLARAWASGKGRSGERHA